MNSMQSILNGSKILCTRSVLAWMNCRLSRRQTPPAQLDSSLLRVSYDQSALGPLSGTRRSRRSKKRSAERDALHQFMSTQQQAPKPSLTGVRIKARKGAVKAQAKHEPQGKSRSLCRPSDCIPRSSLLTLTRVALRLAGLEAPLHAIYPIIEGYLLHLWIPLMTFQLWSCARLIA